MIETLFTPVGSRSHEGQTRRRLPHSGAFANSTPAPPTGCVLSGAIRPRCSGKAPTERTSQ